MNLQVRNIKYHKGKKMRSVNEMTRKEKSLEKTINVERKNKSTRVHNINIINNKNRV